MFGKLAVGLALTALVAYGVFEALPLALGPSLIISSPIDGQMFQGGIARIEGSVLRATKLSLNGTALLPDGKGSFVTTLAFPTGTSILTFTASDRFGRAVTVTRNIYVPAREPQTTNQ